MLQCLAVRAGYLNFYLAGQSLARVRFDRAGDLVADTHHKYVYPDATGQAHVTLGPHGYPDASGVLQPYASSLLPAWMKAARGHSGEEKTFVDALVSANADVIDLEMALPAHEGAPAGPVAPRMGLVAIEAVPGTSDHRIVFWEAKRVTDTRCRCQGDAAPEVVAQLSAYTRWLAHGDHRAVVAAAYQQVCRELVAFHRLAGTLRDELPPLDAARLRRERHPVWSTGVTPLGCFNVEGEPFPADLEASIRAEVEGGFAVCDDGGVVIIPAAEVNEAMLEKLEKIELQEDIWYYCLNVLKWDTKKIVVVRDYLREPGLLPAAYAEVMKSLETRLDEKK